MFKLRTLYDIVGWIFSVVGYVPDGATREKYYYPLMMIAYVFCKKLVPDIPFQPLNGNPIVRSAPDVWVVMWFTGRHRIKKLLVTHVVLGAILDMPTSDVKDGTKEFRKKLLIDEKILEDGKTAPMKNKLKNPKEPSNSKRGQDFGHCTESYPLLFICS